MFWAIQIQMYFKLGNMFKPSQRFLLMSLNNTECLVHLMWFVKHFAMVHIYCVKDLSGFVCFVGLLVCAYLITV